MKDGKFDVCFTADGYSGSGWAEVKDRRLRGGDGDYKLAGQVAEAGQKLIATIDVTLEPNTKANAHIEKDFTVQMTGATDERGFTLLGVGPLGVIVEIACTAAASDERRQ